MNSSHDGPGRWIHFLLKKAGILTQENLTTLSEKAQYADSLEDLLHYLDQAGILTQENFTILCKNVQYARSLECGLRFLYQAGILTQENFTILSEKAEYAESLAVGLLCLCRARILTQENFTILSEKAEYAESLAVGLLCLCRARILTQENFTILCEKAQYANWLADGVHLLYQAGILTQENFTIFSEKADARLLAWLLRTLHEAKIEIKKSSQLIHDNNIYKYIYTDDTGKFNNQQKIVAFFIVNQKNLIENPTSPKTNKILSEIKPASLSKQIKKILNKMGGYSFMPDGEENITLGIEIEYSNIPAQYKELIQMVMDIIQTGWSHPEDSSVQLIGENTYSGEATTPIISNNTELKQAMLNVAFLQAMGAETNASCGLHVHIGVENIKTPVEFEKVDERFKDVYSARSYTAYQLEFIKKFLGIYKREEARFAQIERSYTKYSLAINIKDIKDFDRLDDLINKINPDGRNYELNLHAFHIHGTIEVRRFAGTTKEAHIFATTSMISAMAQEAKAQTNNIFNNKLLNAATEKKSEKNLEPHKTSGLLVFFKRGQTERQRELFTLRRSLS